MPMTSALYRPERERRPDAYVPFESPEEIDRGPVGAVLYPPSRKDVARIVDPLGTLPAKAAKALEAYNAARSETFTPAPDLAALGVPSLVREAHDEWKRTHRRDVCTAWRTFHEALRSVAAHECDQAGHDVAQAIADDSEPDFAAAMAAGSAWRPRLPTGIRGRRQGRTLAQILPNDAPEWVLAAPALWHDMGRPAVTARLARQHAELGIGCYAPDQVVANINRQAAG